MIQDIFPAVLDNQFNTDIVPKADDRVICIDRGRILICNLDEGEMDYPKVRDLDSTDNLIYLFSIDKERYFLAENINPDNCEYYDIRELRSSKRMLKYRLFAMLTANHLNDWYRDSRFCGRCGGITVHSKSERAKICPKCNATYYPKICPAVIVGVINGDKLLLTKYRVGYRHNALVAGFVEIGETVEETVRREVMEETGLKVKNIRYYKSQPWGLADDILMGFYCDVDGDDVIHMDENELSLARWVERNNIELQPDSSSLTNEMMYKFKIGEEI